MDACGAVIEYPLGPDSARSLGIPLEPKATSTTILSLLGVAHRLRVVSVLSVGSQVLSSRLGHTARTQRDGRDDSRTTVHWASSYRLPSTESALCPYACTTDLANLGLPPEFCKTYNVSHVPPRA